ncbi:PTS ascorbate transporter subunit IIC [Suicoccus acidiformans]|nr:PTS transporter subunit IIC [Suicoccus acidiformans]
MREILNFIIFQILNNSAIFLGIIALIGLLLQRKTLAETIDGVVKTIVGLVILDAGAGIISNSIAPIVDLLNKSTGINGVLPANEAAFAIAMETLSTNIVLSFLLGFILHLILVKIIPNKNFKHVYLTVHQMLIVSSFLHVALPYVINVSNTLLIIIAAILLALYWTIGPAIARIYTKDFTDDEITLGHANHLGAWLGGVIGNLVGKPEEDAENLELPGILSIFKDTTISLAFIMPIIYIIIGLIVGSDGIVTLSNDTNWFIWLFLSAMQFTAGFVILMSGVRMFTGSIVPAFQGIADKFLPGAVPALDVAVFYAFSPTGSLLGFLGSILGTIIYVIFSLIVRINVIVFPSPIIMFFDGCLIGVVGNKRGGWKAALIAGAIAGFITHLGFAFLYPMTTSLYGSGLTFSNIDYSLVWLPLMWFLRLFS